MMKRFFLALVLAGAARLCVAQDVIPSDPPPATPPPPTSSTLDFIVVMVGSNEVPSADTVFRGAGRLNLSGNVLSYDVGLSFPNLSPIGGGIYGPAGTGTNGDIIFAWTNYAIVPGAPDSSFRGAWQYNGSYTLTGEQIEQLTSGLWYVNIQSASFPDGEVRGQILVTDPKTDADGDGIPDDQDVCPNSPLGAVVDATGCSIQDLVPCSAPWESHDDYVRAVKNQSEAFYQGGFITARERKAIQKQAQDSICGAPRSQPAQPADGTSDSASAAKTQGLDKPAQ